jgi:hypothetical protein
MIDQGGEMLLGLDPRTGAEDTRGVQGETLLQVRSGRCEAVGQTLLLRSTLPA